MGVVILIILAVVVVCFFISLSLRRHGESERPKPDWRRTEELFNDPSTNRVMRVWLDAAGERHYVPEGTRRAS
ncbi:MAG: hypothetical protein ABSA07_06055 [Acidimicrobiales bacterium]|jgi:hypothetical protein